MSDGIAILDENYPTANAMLVATFAGSVIYVFNASDWRTGLQDKIYAIGFSFIDTGGTWATPVSVIPGTYVVVIFTGKNTKTVLQDNLVVAEPTESFSTSILTDPAPIVEVGQIGLGATTGFGDGSPGATVSTTNQGTGDGPTAPDVIVGYIKFNKDGSDIWIPYMV